MGALGRSGRYAPLPWLSLYFFVVAAPVCVCVCVLGCALKERDREGGAPCEAHCLRHGESGTVKGVRPVWRTA